MLGVGIGSHVQRNNNNAKEAALGLTYAQILMQAFSAETKSIQTRCYYGMKDSHDMMSPFYQ